MPFVLKSQSKITGRRHQIPRRMLCHSLHVQDRIHHGTHHEPGHQIDLVYRTCQKLLQVMRSLLHTHTGGLH